MLEIRAIDLYVKRLSVWSFTMTDCCILIVLSYHINRYSSRIQYIIDFHKAINGILMSDESYTDSPCWAYQPFIRHSITICHPRMQQTR